MDSRLDILNSFYNRYDEDKRLSNDYQGKLEYITTMHFIHKYANSNSKVIEIGAGTGRYSIALAKEGMDVTAIELIENNLKILKENSAGIKNIKSFQGDAIDLSRFESNSFDVTLVLGPLYHLYDKEEIDKAINEAIRITKKDGVIMFAYLSIYAIMNNEYFYDNWKSGMNENFNDDYSIIHKKEQLFTGYDMNEFEHLFDGKNVEYLTTVGVDGSIEHLQRLNGFKLNDEDFASFVKWHINFSETRELLGSNSHLLYICKKK